jgi:hypothetical protein
MNETKTSGSKGTISRKPYKPPNLVLYGHVKDIVQSGGGGMSDAADTSKNFCRVAEALYGVDDSRTLLLRSWMVALHTEKRHGWIFVEVYRRLGGRIAALVRARLAPRDMILPLFNSLVEKAFDDRARCLINERHRRLL